MIQVCKNLRQNIDNQRIPNDITLHISYVLLKTIQIEGSNVQQLHDISALLIRHDAIGFISDSMVLLDSRKAEWESEKKF